MLRWRIVTLNNGTEKLEKIPETLEEIEIRKRLHEKSCQKDREYQRNRKDYHKKTFEEKQKIDQQNYENRFKKRFWNKVKKLNEESCMNWMGCIDGDGYGIIVYHGKHEKVHRISYELHIQKLKENEKVYHQCFNRRCVNPKHLSLDRISIEERFWIKVDKEDKNGCKNWLGSTNIDGYGNFNFNGKITNAHRVAWILKYGEIEKNKEVCHTCDNRRCVNIEHLKLDSHIGNMNDMINKNRDNYSHKGENNGMAKLKQEQPNQIREEYAKGGTTYAKLAIKYGVSEVMIGLIIKNKNWKDDKYDVDRLKKKVKEKKIWIPKKFKIKRKNNTDEVDDI